MGAHPFPSTLPPHPAAKRQPEHQSGRQIVFFLVEVLVLTVVIMHICKAVSISFCMHAQIWT